MSQKNDFLESPDQPSLGLVLGRFQPLHPGHLQLIDRAMQDCEEVVVCIGSAEKNEPLTIDVRHQSMSSQLHMSYPNHNWRIVDLVDPEPMDTWPEYVAEKCELTTKESKRFYRADKMPDVYEERLKKLGFSIIYVSRSPFFYRFPDGIYRKVSSATEIRDISAQLGFPIGSPLTEA